MLVGPIIKAFLFLMEIVVTNYFVTRDPDTAMKHPKYVNIINFGCTITQIFTGSFLHRRFSNFCCSLDLERFVNVVNDFKHNIAQWPASCYKASPVFLSSLTLLIV